MSSEVELEIIKKRHQGLSIVDICREYKIDKSTFYRILKRNGREKIIPNKKYKVNDKFFENIDTEEKAYWLGFFYADGYVNDKKGEKSIEIGLSSLDRDHVLLFANCIDSNYPIKDRTTSPNYTKKNGKNCQSTHLRIYNSKLVNDLINLGCMNKKSWKVKYPNFIKKDLESHFIRGYFDGDGSTRKRGPNQYEVSICGNSDFILGLKNSLEEKNITNSYINIRKRDGLASLIISNNKDCTLFYKLIYENMKTKCFLNRKKSILDNITIVEKRKDYKSYRLTDMYGKIYIIDDGLQKFCKKMELDYPKFKRASLRKGIIDGWKIERIKENLKSMKYLKLFEEFVITKQKPKVETEISDKTVDDILKDDFLKGEELEDKEVSQDEKGVYQIKNWHVY